MVVDETHDNADDFERLATLDEEWPDTYEERTKPSSARIEEQGDRQHDTMANMVSRPVTLQDICTSSSAILTWMMMCAPCAIG